MILPTQVDFVGPLVSRGADEALSSDDAADLLRDDAAIVLDGNLRFLSRARCLVHRSLGRGIELLRRGDNLMQLGYANLGDFATEQLGISWRQAQELAWTETELRRFPC